MHSSRKPWGGRGGRGILSRGVSAQGVSALGGVCWGCLPRGVWPGVVSAWGCLLWGVWPGGVRLGECLPGCACPRVAAQGAVCARGWGCLPKELADPRGVPGSPNSFIFMQFSAKIINKHTHFGSWCPPGENPGSATAREWGVCPGGVSACGVSPLWKDRHL